MRDTLRVTLGPCVVTGATLRQLNRQRAGSRGPTRTRHGGPIALLVSASPQPGVRVDVDHAATQHTDPVGLAVGMLCMGSGSRCTLWVRALISTFCCVLARGQDINCEPLSRTGSCVCSGTRLGEGKAVVAQGWG